MYTYILHMYIYIEREREYYIIYQMETLPLSRSGRYTMCWRCSFLVCLCMCMCLSCLVVVVLYICIYIYMYMYIYIYTHTYVLCLSQQWPL